MIITLKSEEPSSRMSPTEAELAAVEEALRSAVPARVSRVLLINPPDGTKDLFQYDTAKRGRYTNYPPYGIGLLATRLREKNIKVEISNLNHELLTACRRTSAANQFDFAASWQTALDQVLAEFKPDVVGVTCMFTMGHGSFREVCRHVKDQCIPVIVGGVHISNDTRRIIDDIGTSVITAAFTGEADLSLPAFFDFLNDEIPVYGLTGIVVPTAIGQVRLGDQGKPDNEELATMPAMDLMKLDALSSEGVIGAFYCFKPTETKFATVLSNRGCRGKCTFCSVRNFNGHGVRHRPVNTVIDELERLHGDHGIGHIMWLDDDLFKDHRRSVELFSELARRDIDLTWDATNGVLAASCTDEVISAAAESGCIAINIGVESGNPQILRLVSKPATVDTYHKAADVLRRFPKIHTSIFLMIGFPDETVSQIQDTISLATEMDMDWYRISQLHPLPNTPIYDSMLAQGLIQDVGSTSVRFNGGAYGKQTQIESGTLTSQQGLEEAFQGLTSDVIPSPELLTDIWFYMNYRLNFARIFDETRPEKIAQLKAHLETLADLISPENGFALYFLAWLYLNDDKERAFHCIQRLEKRLSSSDYWQDKFDVFGLSVEDLAKGAGRVNFTRQLII